MVLRLPCALGALLILALPPAHAAGGHHGVDDASLLEPGQCQFEAWADSYRGRRVSAHAGPACRVGAWEVGFNLDSAAVPGEPRVHAFAPQAKWATAIAPGWAAGLALTASAVEGRYAGFQALVPVTWDTGRNVIVHANIGRDVPRGGGGRTVAGIAAEWAPSASWSFVAERFTDATGRAARLGARWAPDAQFSVDVSRAQSRDARGGWWTVGANFVFDRR